jgi:outer membrane protein TolC
VPSIGQALSATHHPVRVVKNGVAIASSRGARRTPRGGLVRGFLAAISSLVTLSSLPSALAAQDADRAPSGTPVALEELISAAHDENADLDVARAALSQARSQADEARARLLPAFVATGSYQRNEIQVQVQLSADRIATITPYDQLDARFALNVPILDLSAWATFFSAEASGDAASGRADQAVDDVEVAVTQLYYSLVAGRAMIESAERSRLVAEQALAFATARREAGVAPVSEVARAEAESLRARQMQQEAELQVTLAERNLVNLTGVDLRGRALAPLEGADTSTLEPLEDYLDEIDELPATRAARQDVVAAERGVHAAWLGLAPTVAGSAAERVTNAAGFGPSNQWTLSVTATWQLDFGRPAAIGTRDAVLATTRARLERAEQQARLQIEDAWHRAHALAARLETTEAVLAASTRAAEDTRARYEVGVASQLELVQAERDLFSAEVSRTQARADLAVARATLRIRSHRAR